MDGTEGRLLLGLMHAPLDRHLVYNGLCFIQNRYAYLYSTNTAADVEVLTNSIYLKNNNIPVLLFFLRSSRFCICQFNPPFEGLFGSGG